MKLVKFVAVVDPVDEKGPDYDVRINPEDVSSLLSTDYSGKVRVAMRNSQIFLVRGTVDEVEGKLRLVI